MPQLTTSTRVAVSISLDSSVGWPSFPRTSRLHSTSYSVNCISPSPLFRRSISAALHRRASVSAVTSVRARAFRRNPLPDFLQPARRHPHASIPHHCRDEQELFTTLCALITEQELDLEGDGESTRTSRHASPERWRQLEGREGQASSNKSAVELGC